MEFHSRNLAVGDLRHGSHAALLYSSRAEQSDALKTFVDETLHAHDRLIYVGDAEHGERALKYYGAAGARAIASGQFILENSSNTYLKDGAFEGGRMLRHYRTALDTALADGYKGLRVAADMGWAVPTLDRHNALAAYEGTLDDAFAGRPAVVLCQYDRRLFDEEALALLAAAHQHSAHPDPLHQSPQLRITRTYEPNGVHVSGEIDLFSRTAFREALMRVAASRESGMVVDLSGVSYLDAGSIGAIVNAARHAKGSVIAIRVPAHLHRMFETLEPTLPGTVHVEEVG